MPCDYKKYHPEWKTKIRPDILERANNCCEVCGVPNYAIIHRVDGNWILAPEGHMADAMALDGIKFVKIILTIAHLDHDITHNEYSNLKAMCQKCHNSYDTEYRKGNRKNTLQNKKKQLNIF